MKKLVIFLILAIIVVVGTQLLAGEQWTVNPRFPDFNPMDRGTWQNPYELQDQFGQTRGTIQPRYYDFTPNDGHFDRGTWSNPYELQWGD